MPSDVLTSSTEIFSTTCWWNLSGRFCGAYAGSGAESLCLRVEKSRLLVQVRHIPHSFPGSMLVFMLQSWAVRPESLFPDSLMPWCCLRLLCLLQSSCRSSLQDCFLGGRECYCCFKSLYMKLDLSSTMWIMRQQTLRVVHFERFIHLNTWALIVCRNWVWKRHGCSWKRQRSLTELEVGLFILIGCPCMARCSPALPL